MPVIDIWVNCPDRDVAGTIAEALIGARLVACANIFAPVQSVYRWKGAIERETEVPLLLKTRAELFDTVAAEVERLHPYETPGIMAVPLARVNADYEAWLVAETADPSDRPA